VLGVLRERGRRGLPCNELYRQMFNPQLYLAAYGRIYSNQGAMTPGASAETVDGMSLGKIERIIDAMRHERYRFSPVKRVLIPKKNGKLRPLGLPGWTDKLVGEVMRLLLEAHPPEHGHVIDVDATLGQQFFNISIREPVAQVPSNSEHDHIRWRAEPREAGPQCWHSTRATTHRPSLPDLALHQCNRPRGGRSRPGRRRIPPPCPSPSSVNATDPGMLVNPYLCALQPGPGVAIKLTVRVGWIRHE
jgi:hypothetical protein